MILALDSNSLMSSKIYLELWSGRNLPLRPCLFWNHTFWSQYLQHFQCVWVVVRSFWCRCHFLNVHKEMLFRLQVFSLSSSPLIFQVHEQLTLLNWALLTSAGQNLFSLLSTCYHCYQLSNAQVLLTRWLLIKQTKQSCTQQIENRTKLNIRSRISM